MKIDTATLRMVLADISQKIGEGDSFEGTLTYSCMEEDLAPGIWEASASYRVGNRDGQGGLRELPSSSAQAEADAMHPIAVPVTDLPPGFDQTDMGGPVNAMELANRLSDAERTEVLSFMLSRAAFRDPARPERACDRCGQPYRGPGLYCCHACATLDAGS